MDVDPIQFLNGQLSQKPLLRLPFQRREIRQRCRIRRVAGDWVDVCEEYAVLHNEERPGAATVTAAEVVEIKDFRFDEAKKVSFPINARVRTESFKNCSDSATLTKSFTLSLSVTNGWSVSKTRGLSTTVGASVNISGNIKFAKASSNVSFSQTVSASTTASENYSTTESRSSTDTVTIKPRSAGDFSLLAFEETLEVPFSASIVLDGPLASNLSGVARARELLSELERTTPFEGVLRITDASRGETSIRHFDWEVVCTDGDGDHLHLSTSEFSVPLSRVSPALLNTFAPPEKHARAGGVAVGVAFQSGDSIGSPPDGRVFEVLYSVEEVRGDFGNCGFNDLGLPNTGVYRVDYGTWHEFSGGKEVATYAGKQEEFLRCFIP